MTKDADCMPSASLAAPSDTAVTGPASDLFVPRGLSIVVPVYRGAATIGVLVEALTKLHPDGGMEVVLVNDGSPDNSGEICRALVRAAPMPIVYVEHARNYGEHNAVMTGLRHASGAYVITMDDDLQNPAEEVLKLYDHARLGGWDVVYTRTRAGAIWAAASPTRWRTGCSTSRAAFICRRSAACRRWWCTPSPATAAPTPTWTG
jgi:undecaprenyl-phosphate 4-deoxy-4-formamido-L-arabinose transferase